MSDTMQSTQMLLRATALAAALFAAGCAVGPDYQRPASPLDGSFMNVGASRNNDAATTAEITTFWRGFNDAALNALIERSMSANGDVRIAQARLQEARSLQRVADAGTLPTIGAQAHGVRAVAPRPVGGNGGVAGGANVVAKTGAEGAESPAPLVARTRYQ